LFLPAHCRQGKTCQQKKRTVDFHADYGVGFLITQLMRVIRCKEAAEAFSLPSQKHEDRSLFRISMVLPNC
jgi:hypothetical protein